MSVNPWRAWTHYKNWEQGGGILLTRIAFIGSPETKAVLSEVDDKLALSRAQPFQNQTQKYNYFMQLGALQWLDNQGWNLSTLSMTNQANSFFYIAWLISIFRCCFGSYTDIRDTLLFCSWECSSCFMRSIWTRETLNFVIEPVQGLWGPGRAWGTTSFLYLVALTSFGDTMVYTETYDSADTSAIVIDVITGVLVSLVAFGALIGLIMLYRWFKKKSGM